MATTGKHCAIADRHPCWVLLSGKAEVNCSISFCLISAAEMAGTVLITGSFLWRL